MYKRHFGNNEERSVLTAMIVHDGALSRLHRYLAKERKPFRSRWSNIVAGWCLEYFAKYKKAPKHSIESIFHEYAAGTKNHEAVDLIEKLLAGLSEDYKAIAEEINEDYVIDLASGYFRRIQLERCAQKIESSLEKNDVDAAASAVQGLHVPDFSSASWIDPFDPEAIKTVMAKKENRELVRFGGALGRFLSPHFERDGFIAFAGPEKRGKSFWLQEVAWKAMIEKRKVLHYTVGDMSQDQILNRFLVRAARRPFRAGSVGVPVTLHKEEKRVRVEMVRKVHASDMTLKEISRKMERIRMKTASKQSRLKLRCVGASMLSAGDIEREVAEFCQEGWEPDVVVIDYADLLAPEPSTAKQDYRHQVNETWKILRRIAQNHHLLLVTATQTAATSYNAWTIRKGDFSEDKRKNAHVTGMLGINQAPEEKEQGIYRLNWVFLRNGAWSENQVVWTAGNLEVACPCMISSFLRKPKQ